MAEKKGLFGLLRGDKTKSSCCSMEIVEETEKQTAARRTAIAAALVNLLNRISVGIRNNL